MSATPALRCRRTGACVARTGNGFSCPACSAVKFIDVSNHERTECADCASRYCNKGKYRAGRCVQTTGIGFSCKGCATNQFINVDNHERDKCTDCNSNPRQAVANFPNLCLLCVALVGVKHMVNTNSLYRLLAVR